MKLKAPLNTQIEVTSGCNYNCNHCYNSFDHKLVSMNNSQIDYVINELSDNEVFSLIFTGGEPFMNRRVLMRGLEIAQERERDTYLNTNLSVPLKKEEVNILRNVRNVLFSFPSSDPRKYSKITNYDGLGDVLRNLEILVANNVTLTANQVVIPLNKDGIYENASFLRDSFDIRNFCATPVNPSGYSREQYFLDKKDYTKIARELLKIKTDLDMDVEMLTCLPPCLFEEDIRSGDLVNKVCSAGKSASAIGVTGEVRRCVESEQSYGNIFQEPLSKIWNRIISEEKNPHNICENCPIKMGCSFGCEVRAFKNGGIDPLIRGPIPNFSQQFIPEIDSQSIYSLRRFMIRSEENQYIITDGGSFLISGNEALINFLNKLKYQNFNIDQIKEKLGERGLGLIKYLNSQGLIERK